MRSAMLEALTLTTESTSPEVDQALPVVWTSAEWVAYFRANAERLFAIPWEAGAGVSPEEIAVIVESLRAWPLGEMKDGGHLRAAAKRHAAETSDPEFESLIDLYIAEELGHGATLGRFLDLAGVPRRERYWGDTIMRGVRHFLSRVESCSTIAAMAESHALLYYSAVRRATGSEVLRRICELLLHDEIPHIRFHSERLAIIHRKRGRLLRWLTGGVHRVLFTAMTLAVWAGHRDVLRMGGFTFGKYWRSAWAKMGVAWRAMKPESYRWSETK